MAEKKHAFQNVQLRNTSSSYMSSTRSTTTEHVASPVATDYHSTSSPARKSPAPKTPKVPTPKQPSPNQQPGSVPSQQTPNQGVSSPSQTPNSHDNSQQSPNTQQPQPVSYYIVPDGDRSEKISQIILILGCFIPCLWWSPLYLFKDHPNPSTQKMTNISTAFAILQTLILLALLGAVIYGAFDTADSTLREATRH